MRYACTYLLYEYCLRPLKFTWIEEVVIDKSWGEDSSKEQELGPLNQFWRVLESFPLSSAYWSILWNWLYNSQKEVILKQGGSHWLSGKKKEKLTVGETRTIEAEDVWQADSASWLLFFFCINCSLINSCSTAFYLSFPWVEICAHPFQGRDFHTASLLLFLPSLGLKKMSCDAYST